MTMEEIAAEAGVNDRALRERCVAFLNHLGGCISDLFTFQIRWGWSI